MFVTVTGVPYVLLGGAGEALLKQPATLEVFPDQFLERRSTLKKTPRVTAAEQIQPFILTIFIIRGCWGFYKLHSLMSIHLRDFPPEGFRASVVSR